MIIVLSKGRSNTQLSSRSEQSEKMKKDTLRSEVTSEDPSKGSKTSVDKSIKKRLSSPEKQASSKNLSRASTPEKKSIDNSRKLSVNSVEGRGSSPESPNKDKGVSSKKSIESDKNKNSPPGTKIKKNMAGKPAVDELPLQKLPKKNFELETANTTKTKKQPASPQLQKSGSSPKLNKGIASIANFVLRDIKYNQMRKEILRIQLKVLKRRKLNHQMEIQTLIDGKRRTRQDLVRQQTLKQGMNVSLKRCHSTITNLKRRSMKSLIQKATSKLIMRLKNSLLN